MHATANYHLIYIAEDMSCKSITKTFKTSNVSNIINLAGFGIFFALRDKIVALIEYRNDG